MQRLAMLLIALVFAAPQPTVAEPDLKVAALKFGTVNWLMDTIQEHDLDAAAGYELEAIGLASTPATKVAFQAGEADVLVTDWIWALRQREKGRDLRFAPYSVALGALVSLGAVTELCGLKGRPVGVVGGEFDKSWLVLQALVRTSCGYELAEETEALFGAPPLMSRQLQEGTVDAVSTYWHWAAKLEAAGATRIIGVTDALVELGISPAPPLIGFVWDAGRTDAATLAAFLDSVTAARTILATDDAEWERLRPRMKPKDDAEFRALRAHFRSGIPGPWTPAHSEAAKELHKLLIENAGATYARDAGRFDPDAFAPPGNGG